MQSEQSTMLHQRQDQISISCGLAQTQPDGIPCNTQPGTVMTYPTFDAYL
jgi:hypothetical protein